MRFPEGFVWGAASSAYQVEGASAEAGRGPSVWDAFCARPGNVRGNDTGDAACDHHHRYTADVELMAGLGLHAYRLSIAWPRILPTGTGPVNDAGLAFYDRLIDALLAAGITPYVTLYHWDMPQALQERGGWQNRESVGWFADYVTAVVRRLSDRVRYWMTLNEPQVFISHGHFEGIHAPGLKLARRDALQAGHHALLAHGAAVRAIRAESRQSPKVGYAPMLKPRLPASSAAADVTAAQAATFTAMDEELFNNAWWLDSVLHGAYPEAALRHFGADAPAVQDGDMESMSAPLDFLGINIYSGVVVRANGDGLADLVAYGPGHASTAFRWAVAPEALYWGPLLLHERYGLPMYITENGLSSLDWVSLDGRVHDPQRIDFTQRYLLALARAIRDGADVRGYFHWSIMDNFEWAEGYRQRFGLVHVDYATQTRTLKDSAYWYQQVIASNGAALDAPYTYPRPDARPTAAAAVTTQQHGE